MKKTNYIKILILSIITTACSSTKQDNKTAQMSEFKNAVIYTTAENTSLRLSKTANVQFSNAIQPLETEVFIAVNPSKEFQTFLGIGGAITDAAAEVYAKLPREKQNEILKAYYSDEGINYNIIRTNINSCDFSSSSYTYIQEGDAELKTFDIAVDKRFKIPFIKQAASLIKDDLVFYASPWSPPAFMKSNNHMLKGGSLLPQYYESWANYYAKFIKAYENEGIPVWGLTIQNEPMASQTWESCIYTAEQERDFLKNHLGPTLKKEGLGDKKIIVWDHNRDLIAHRANTIFDDPEAAKYAWGIGFHWYETWTGASANYENIQYVNETYPSKNLLFTEGCQEKFDPLQYQRWSNAERYGNAIINDFNNGTVGWTDWNILLDEKGGPNHVQNFCFAPIHADLRTNEIIYTPTYFYIGHFSKFIKPNAKRIANSSSRTTLETTAFKNPDGQIVTIVMNKTEQETAYKLMNNNKEIKLVIPAKAIQTIIIN